MEEVFTAGATNSSTATAVCSSVCVYAGAVHVHGGSCVTQQVMDKPVWPAMQTVLVPLWLLMTEAVEQAAFTVHSLFSREVFWTE